MADISEYLRNKVQKPRRKKREGKPQSLWAAPTLASDHAPISDLSDQPLTEDFSLKVDVEIAKQRHSLLSKERMESVLPNPEKTNEKSDRNPALNETASSDLLHPEPSNIEIFRDKIAHGTKKRYPPVTVGKSSTLPSPPVEFDFEKDERFLSKYWMSPGPGKVPRNQERFFNFYRYLYNEAIKTQCARVYFTEPMAIEILGPKARGTFTNYRKLGVRYGLFTTHIVSNLNKSGNKPGTYFYLCDPWKNQ